MLLNVVDLYGVKVLTNTLSDVSSNNDLLCLLTKKLKKVSNLVPIIKNERSKQSVYFGGILVCNFRPYFSGSFL